jgi:divalent metal cation (Fe/Co/Zn/Cd) transporter
MSGGRKKKGGMMGLVSQAIVPFGLLAAQKKSQKRHRHGHKSYKKHSFRKRR